jgi:Zn-dependent protease
LLDNLDYVQVILAFLVLLFSLTVHEAAHAWSADRLGDDTARRLGRVSLNPIVHADLVGTVAFPLLAMTTGLPLIGWAKPVPVNVAQLSGNWREKFMLIAAAGPASNLVLALGAAVLFRLAAPYDAAGSSEVFGATGPGTGLLVRLVELNVLLAVFNMIPIPPLDGGNVLAGLVEGPVAEIIDRLRPYGFLILYALMLSGALWAIVAPVESRIVGWLL